MVNLQKIDDSSVKFVFTDSDHYLVGNGEIVVPINSLSLVIDESEMVTFKKSATGDPFISFRADNSNLGTKEAIEQFYKENMVGAGGISQEEVQDMIDSAMSGVPSSQVVEQLRTDVNTISGKVDGNASDIIDIYETIDLKEEVIASALTEVRQDVDKKASVCYVDFWGMFNDEYEMDDAKWNEIVEAYNNNAIFYVIPNDENQTASPLYVAYDTSDGNYIWFNIPYGNGYASLYFNRIDGRDGYEYEVANAEEYYINVDDHLDSGSTNLVQNAVITQALNAKADASALTSIESSITAVSNDLNTLSGAVIDNEYTVSQSLNDLNSRKLDASAYTPTDLSQYWTSAQTQSAIDDAKAYYVDFAAMSVQGITDADWDGLVAAINAHRPILVKVGTANGYVNATTAGIFDNTIEVTGADEGNASKYTFTKNGSNDYSVSTSTKNFVTQAEKDAWNAKQDALVSGTNIKTINNESILGSGNIDIQGGGGKAIEAGRGISITTGETADTVSFNLPISAGTRTNNIKIGGGTSSGQYSLAGGAANTKSLNYASFAWGEGAEANVSHSTVFGHYSHGNGLYSFANGEYVNTNNEAEHSQGKYNISNKANDTWGDSGNTLFSVGNGTSSSARHNAFEIRQNGDIYVNDGTNDVKLQDTITATASNTTALGGLKLVKLTQAEYDALEQAGTLDSSTLYIVSNVVS